MIVARLIVPAAFREPDTAAVLTGLSLLRPARGLLREMVGKRRDWFIEQVKDRPVGGAPKVLRQPFELTSGFIREAKDPVIRLPYGIRSARLAITRAKSVWVVCARRPACFELARGG